MEDLQNCDVVMKGGIKDWAAITFDDQHAPTPNPVLRIVSKV